MYDKIKTENLYLLDASASHATYKIINKIDVAAARLTLDDNLAVSRPILDGKDNYLQQKWMDKNVFSRFVLQINIQI